MNFGSPSFRSSFRLTSYRWQFLRLSAFPFEFPLALLIPISLAFYISPAASQTVAGGSILLAQVTRVTEVTDRDLAGAAGQGSESAAASVPSAAPAASSPPTAAPARTSFGVEQLIGAAVATHPTVAMRRLEQSASGSIVQAAKLQFYPTPSVSLDSLQGRQATVFRLSQPLWTGGRLTADLTAAELKQTRTQVAVGDSQLTLALRVVTLYQSFLLQSGRIDSQRRGTDKLEQLVVMIERRVKSGVSAQIDLDLARSRLAQARSDLIALTSSQRSVLAQLSQAVGRPLQLDEIIQEQFDPQMIGQIGPRVDARPGAGATELDAASPASPLDRGSGRSGSETAASASENVAASGDVVGRGPMRNVLDQALISSPSVQLASIDAQIARNEITQTKAALWPTVSVRAEHQEGSFTGSQASGGRVYLSLQYTPGAGASVIPHAAAAAVRAEAAEQVVQTARREVSDRVEVEWLDFQSASARIPELERTRAGSSDVLDSSVRLFVTGRRTWLDLLNSVRELMQTEQLEVDARATGIGSSYRLRLLAGESMWSRDGVTP
ncbi:hypothetical protein BH09PSE5_BH09PSE5_25090 [soil metagenome]